VVNSGYKIFKSFPGQGKNDMEIVESIWVGEGNEKVEVTIVEEIPGKLYYVICSPLRFFEYCKDLNQCRSIALSLSDRVKGFLYA